MAAIDDDDDDMEVNREEDDDDDDDDTSDEDDDEEVDDSKQETELNALREIVQSNPYNYQGHVDYITLSRQYANLDHLRFAREKMSEIYPLTEQLWLEWINDEKLLLLSTTVENANLIQLFERAINDYLSVNIWIEYIQYRIPFFTSIHSIEQLRNFFERALNVCGTHLIDGQQLWSAFIETERAILNGLMLNYNENKNNDDLREKLVQHVDFILKLYHRQLTIPLRGMENIYSKDYQEFIQEYKEYLPMKYHEQFDLILKRDYDKANELLEKYERLEDELIQTNRSVSTYEKYIQTEKEPTRIQCLYERAIVDNCLNGDLWISYIDFIEDHLSSPSIIQSIFERSLRNVPWIAILWIRYAEYLELKNLVDHSQLKQIYDRALNSDPSNLVSFVQIQLAYFQYRRRHFLEQSSSETLKEEIRHLCEYACDQYQELFLSSDNSNLFLKYNGQLELFWIHLETVLFQSIEHARLIWNGRTLMNKTHNQMISNLWKNYYYMELNYGDEKHARKVLYRALNYVTTMDFPMIICDLLLDHEKKYGTIQQLKETEMKLRQVKQKIVPKEKPQRGRQQQTTSSNKKQTNKEKTKETKKKTRKNSDNQMETTTTPIVQTNGKSTEQQQPQQSSPRKRKLSPEETETAKKKPSAAAAIDSQGFKIPAIPPPPPPSTAATSSSSTATTSKDIDHLNTVFVANLSYDANEEDIRQALSSAGPIKEIRIVRHEWSGKSKGFGYVDFTTREGHQEALKLDHTLINGRPMYVSTYDPNKSASNDLTKKFKYATTLEQNKLFLSGLPFSAKKEDIEKLFLDNGFKVKDVRLVTQKSGKSKGLAYAEFENPQAASQAILKLNETDMDGHTIKVAISNPPQRKDQGKTTPMEKMLQPRATALGGAPKSTGARGKGHSQIALVPRKVAATSSKAPSAPAAATTTTTTTSTANSMSNNDFRNMLLNQK